MQDSSKDGDGPQTQGASRGDGAPGPVVRRDRRDFLRTLGISSIPSVLVLFVSVVTNYCMAPYAARRVDEPDAVVHGVQPFHIYEVQETPFIHRRDWLGLLFKVEHRGGVETTVEFAEIQGCAAVLPEVAADILGDGLRDGTTAEDWERLHRRYGQAKQLVKTSAAVGGTPADRILRKQAVGYFAVLFDFPLGGAFVIEPGTVIASGDCHAAPSNNRHPNLFQVFSNWSASEPPSDVAQELRTGDLALLLRVGTEDLRVPPEQIEKFRRVSRATWDSIDWARMYENPDTMYPPRRTP